MIKFMTTVLDVMSITRHTLTVTVCELYILRL